MQLLAESRSTALPTSTCAASVPSNAIGPANAVWSKCLCQGRQVAVQLANIALPPFLIHQEITPLHVVVEKSRKYLHSSHVPATHTLRPTFLVIHY